MGQEDVKLWVAIISAVIAFGSLVVLMYKEFWQGARLMAVLDNISLLRLPNTNKGQLYRELLIDDLTANQPPPDAVAITQNVPPIQAAIQTGQRNLVGQALDAYVAGLSAQNVQIPYKPSLTSFKKYMGHALVATTFYVPLIITNAGRKTGHVSSLVLAFRKKGMERRGWIFSAFTEIEATKLLPANDGRVLPDQELIKSFFVGVSVPALSSIAIHPWFIPIPGVGGLAINATSMMPGNYEVMAYGFGPRKRQMFQTKWVEFSLREEALFESFQGATSLVNVTTEDYVKRVMKNLGWEFAPVATSS